MFELRPGRSLPVVNCALKDKRLTLSDVVFDLKASGAALVHEVSESKFCELYDPWDHGTESLYEAVQAYLTPEDKEHDNPVFLVFVKNGMIPYSAGDVLSEFQLDEPRYFMDFKVSDERAPDTGKAIVQYELSPATDAIDRWSASFNYEVILPAFDLEASGEMASFVGFFFISG